MKYFFNILSKITISFFILFTISSCDVIDDIFNDVTSECDAEENKINPSEERTFVLSAIVKYKDGMIAEGFNVSFHFKHEYCSGKINGENDVYPASKSNANGYVFSSYHQTYLYNNVKDLSHVEIRASYGSCTLGKTIKVFRWEDVDEDFDEHVAGQVVRTYDVILKCTLAELLAGSDEGIGCLD